MPSDQNDAGIKDAVGNDITVIIRQRQFARVVRRDNNRKRYARRHGQRVAVTGG